MIHDRIRKDPIERLAEMAADARRAASSVATSPNGSASWTNADGSRTVIGAQNVTGTTMATHIGDVTPPGVPTGVTATSTSGMLTVRWDGTLTGGVPGDFAHMSVYVDGEGSKSLLGSLSRAGDLTAAGLTEGATYRVTATAEDDACLADGTPAHNVSASTEPIEVTIAASGGTDEEARQLAQEALDAVSATNQHFWSDGSGVHVSTEAGNAAGPSNVLVNALGILLRAAQNGLLALTPSGITLYDGKGNADANVVATFTGSGVELGRNSQTASIDMCKGNLSVTSRRTGVSDYGIVHGKNVTIMASGEGTSGAVLTVGGTPDQTSDMVLGILQDSGDGKGPTVVSQSQVIDARAKTVKLVDVSPNGEAVTWATTDVIRAINHGISTSGKRTWPSRTLWTGYAADGSSINVPGIGDWLIVGVGMQIGMSETNNGVVETIAMIPVAGTSYVGGAGGMSSGSDERQVFVSFSRSGTSLTVRRASMQLHNGGSVETYSRHVIAVYGIL